MTMKNWSYNPDQLAGLVDEVMRESRDSIRLPVRFHSRLPSGLKVADGSFLIRIEVTMGERAAGALRGEDRFAIARRETVETALAAGGALAEMVEAATARLVRLRAAAELIIAGVRGDEGGWKAWRARSLALAIRDLVDDHPGAGAPAVMPSGLKDLLSIDAWLPAAPAEIPDPDRLAATVIGRIAAHDADWAVAELSRLHEQLRLARGAAPDIWRDPITADIAGMTNDTGLRHLLVEATRLRDRAAEFAVTDPSAAKAIIAEATAIEDRTLAEISARDERGYGNDLADTAAALRLQADMKMNKEDMK